MRRARPSDVEGDALLSPTSTSGSAPPPPARLSRRLVTALAVGSALGLAAAGATWSRSGVPASAVLAALTPASTSTSTADQLQALLDQRSAMLVEVIKQRDALRAQVDAVQQPPVACTDRHAPSSPSATSAAADPDLAAALASAAPGGSVLVALANAAYATGPGGGLVGLWASAAAGVGAPALLFALDDEAAAAATAAGVPAFRVDLPIPPAQRGAPGGGAGGGGAPPSNHAVSSLKFGLARRVLALGYTLLFSDVDVLTFRNPFEEGAGLLPLTADVAAASDGWDPASAFGWDDVLDEPALGWARYAHSTRIMHLNSGLWAARPTPAADAAVAAVAARVAAEPGWDQAIFNEVLLTPSHDGYDAPGATVRVLSPDAFMNTRVLWTSVRAAASAAAAAESGEGPPPPPPPPTMLHANYHPDKGPRLAAAADFYEGGGVAALDRLPLKGGE